MRVRFSLRLFLICFTIIAIVFGGGANFVYRVKDQVRRHEAAVAQLERFKFDFLADGQGNEQISSSMLIRLARTWIDSEAYPEVDYLAVRSDRSAEEKRFIFNAARDLGGIRRIRIDGNVPASEVMELVRMHPDVSSFAVDSLDCDYFDQVLTQTKALESFSTEHAISDSVAKKLEQLPQLRGISADISRLTNGAESLGRLPALETVLLTGSVKTQVQLASLFRNRNLTELALFDCHIHDGVLAAFEEARGLQKLTYWRRDSKPPKDFLRLIAKAPALRTLVIRVDEGLDTENLQCLAEQGVIEELSIFSQPLSKKDLLALRKARRLRSLTFCGELHDDDVAELLAAVPECKVEMHAVHPSDREADTKKFTLVDGLIQVEKNFTIHWCQ